MEDLEVRMVALVAGTGAGGDGLRTGRRYKVGLASCAIGGGE